MFYLPNRVNDFEIECTWLNAGSLFSGDLFHFRSLLLDLVYVNLFIRLNICKYN